MRDRDADTRARQLTFDLAGSPSYDPDDFLESPSNAEAYALVTRWPDWPDRTLLVTGPPGSGKTHLGSIWAASVGARRVRCGEALDPAAFECPTIAFVEDCDRAGHGEAALFHLLNLVRESGGWLLMTARQPPMLWRLQTPDLISRLRLAPLVALERPDPALIRAVIVKLFADRQIRIDEDVVGYAARHCEQSLEAINRFVAAVDEESLSAGRRITRPLAAQAIARLAPDDQGPT